MADGKVLLEVVVEGKNVKVVQRQVEGVTKAVNENTATQQRNTKSTKVAADAQDHFSRGLKGVGQASLSSGKALSKQRDLIGSSSFVGAYATLAANLFAATAAFEAFKKAADVEKVIKSIEVLGTSSGTNIKRIGDNIQRITGYGLSMGEAMKAASLGVSAGFDANQLETLAKVAKGASAALGRDLGDSYDRLIRGAAKLEPEILDELGIIVKIEKATQDYAASIGKTVKELSQYERTQAFVNAINTQGITKFGLLAEAVETSPYDKFAASLSNLATASLNWLSNIGKIPDFLSYLSENMFTLGGAIALFASTISKQMLPVLYEGPQNAAIAAEVAAKQATEAVDVAKNAGQTLGQTTKKLPEGYKKLLPAIQAGTASMEDQKKAVNSLSKSIKYYDNALSTGKDLRGRALSPEKIQEYTATQAALKTELKDFQAVQKGVSKTQIEASRAVAKQNVLTAKSNTLLAASSLSISGALSGLGASFSAYKAQALAATTSTNGFTRALAALKAGAFTAVLGIRALGSALLAALPYLGLLITFGPMIKDWFVNKFFPEGEIEKRGQMIESLFSKITELTTFLSKTNLQFEINAKEPNFNASIEGLKLIAASFKEIRTSINSLLNEIATKSQEISKTLYIQPAQAAYAEAAAGIVSIDTDIRKEEQRLNLINDVIAGKKKINDLDFASMVLVRTGQLELSELQALAIGELDDLKARREEALKDAKTFEGKLLESYNLATFKTTVSEIEGTLSTLPQLITKSTKGVEQGSIYKTLLQKGAPGAQVAKDISERLKSSGEQYTRALIGLKNEMADAEKEGPVSQEQATSFRQRFNEIRTSYDETLTKSTQDAELFLGKVKGMSDEVSAVLKTTAEAAGINATPFDKPLESLEALTSGLKTGTKEAEIYNQALKEIFKQESADKLSFDPEKLKKSLRAGATATRNLAIEQAKLQSLESLGSNLKDIAGVDFVLQQQKVKVIDNQLTIQKAQLDLATATNASEQDKAIIITEITRLENERIQGLGAEIEAQQKILSVTNKIFEAEKRSFDLSLDTQKNKLLLSKPGLTLSTREEDALIREQYTARLDFAQKEYNLKIQAIDLEYKLLNAQYALFRERAVKEGYSQKTLKILDDSMAQMGQAQAAAFRVAGAEYENLQSILELDLQKASLNFASKVQVSVGSVMNDITDIFYDKVKNAVSLSQQLAETFANTIDAAVDAFVDAIVEGKNAFKAIGTAVRDTIREGFAEIAKSKIKEGIAGIFLGLGNEDMAKAIQGPQERAATASEAAAKNTYNTSQSISSTQIGIPKVVELLDLIETNTKNCCMSGAAGSTTLTGGAGADLLDRVMGSIGTGPAVQPDTAIPEEYDGIDEMVVTAKRSEGIFSKIFGSIKGLLTETKDGNAAQSEGFSLLSSSIGSLAGSLLSSIGPGIGKTGGAIGGTLMNAGLASGNMWLAGAGAVASFLGFEKGGVMSSSGPMPLQKYANGGIARSPQLAMFGEGSKPEAYVPLPDGRSIPVTMAGGGGNVNNISVNVAVDNKGNAQTQTSGGADNTEEYSRRLGAAISNAVKQEMINQQRPGGLLYRGRR